MRFVKILNLFLRNILVFILLLKIGVLMNIFTTILLKLYIIKNLKK